MRVLFVCLGNICRSPTAEVVFRTKAAAAGLDVECDSAGTGPWNVKKKADPRMAKAAKARGYDLSKCRGRQVDIGDFYVFDLICPMDGDNVAQVEELRPSDATARIVPFLRYGVGGDVPDPYRGGSKGFETVLDMIEHASDGLLTAIQSGRA